MFEVFEACLWAHLLPHFWAVNSDAMGGDGYVPAPCGGIGSGVNPVKRASRSQDPANFSQHPLRFQVVQKAKCVENRIKLLVGES